MPRVGCLINGYFYCMECTNYHPHKAVEVFRENIGIYSQKCSQCKKLIINGIKQGNGEPLSLFPISDFDFTYNDYYGIKLDIVKAQLANDREAVDSIKRVLIKRVLLAILHNKIEDPDVLIPKILILYERG